MPARLQSDKATGIGRILGRAALVGACLALAACVMPTPDTSPRPEPREAEGPPPPSAESESFARYYASVQARLVSDGMLRTDGGGVDTPFSAAQLAANFERIALYDEYALSGGRFIAQQTPSRLRRWDQPVRIQPHFGAYVDDAQQAEDRSVLSTYVSRLARVSGHPIRVVNSGGNFHVLYINRDEQRTAGDLVRQLVPGISAETVNEIQTLSRFTFCSVYAFSQAGGGSTYVAAIAIIRDEHPDLLRRSCVHEEVAQGMGLPNDSPAARPSIFNDDEEFALLTRHDELLLRILYDDRLTPGMQPDEARPIVRRIAEEVMGGPS
ncbi:DUF2927 domain-containing protein [Roseibacterium beibuensis]|uniref:DUF2927 domain-containing protein n=1 Tax=[Roseibacterium] beibuensis TaxID=1193142 RepID=A0ABP9L1J5_9RHOB|nr:DUF2927 domain-containing protein [Roseibacterium beibuensis]MCS6621788.1 DUF2927 domain-containing protein [Roseibacterium beibuensis]